eukprot:g4187.t1
MFVSSRKRLVTTIVLLLALLLAGRSTEALRFRNRKGGKAHKTSARSRKAPPSEDQAKWASDSSASIQKSIEEAASNAMKFQEEGRAKVEASAEADLKKAQERVDAKADAKVFKVDPPEEEGITIEPSPGQNDPPVKIRNSEDYMDEIETTTDFMGSHSYENDIKELLGEIDESENKVKGLKLRIVEKENFVDSLVKRESMLSEDLRKDKVAVENLNAHVKALNARVERIKSEKELLQLSEQFHQFTAAAEKMDGQLKELDEVKSALYSKMQGLHNRIAPLREQEDTNMRLSINADPADQTAMMMQAAAEMQQKSMMDAALAAGAPGKPPAAAGATPAPAGGEAAAKPPVF